MVDELALPITSDVSRDLFTNIVEESFETQQDIDTFDVDQFLIDNNFQYMHLDSLIREITTLSQKTKHALVKEVSGNYDDYLRLCDAFATDSEDHDTVMELQQSRGDLVMFMNKLKQLVRKDIPKTRDVAQRTEEYLRELDHMSELVHIHAEISDTLTTTKGIAATLYLLCDEESIQEQLCTELVNQINKQVSDVHRWLEKLQHINSPYLQYLRNEYQSLLETCQISFKILTDKCLENPAKYPKLSRKLVEIAKLNSNDNQWQMESLATRPA